MRERTWWPTFVACLLLAAAGAAACQGARPGDARERGAGPALTPRASAAPPLRVMGATAGAFHTCANVGDELGWTYCWGANDAGQLGNDAPLESHVPLLVEPVRVSGTLAAGAFHTCRFDVPATSWTFHCWGYNGYGQLGNGTTADTHVPTETAILQPFFEQPNLAAGAFHTCAKQRRQLTENTWSYNEVWCWGANDSGQLGNGSTAESHVPVNLPGVVSPLVAGSAYAPPGDVAPSVVGRSHTCAAGDGSQATRCWGANEHGQLGDGTTVDRHAPVAVSGLGDTPGGVLGIAAGAYHTCAIVAGTGTAVVKCWGRNDHGQLGNGTTVDSPAPVTVSGIQYATAIAAGAHHTCAAVVDPATPSYSLQCWGLNNHGQLGDGTTLDRLVPVTVPGVEGNVVAGAHHTCAATATGIPVGIGMSCWGANGRGQLGNGSTADSAVPVPVSLSGPTWAWHDLRHDGVLPGRVTRPPPPPPPPTTAPQACDVWGQSCGPAPCCSGLTCIQEPAIAVYGIALCCKGWDSQYDKCL